MLFVLPTCLGHLNVVHAPKCRCGSAVVDSICGVRRGLVRVQQNRLFSCLCSPLSLFPLTLTLPSPSAFNIVSTCNIAWQCVHVLVSRSHEHVVYDLSYWYCRVCVVQTPALGAVRVSSPRGDLRSCVWFRRSAKVVRVTASSFDEKERRTGRT